MDHSRDPCPWVALSDFGGAFCMGVCVSQFYFIVPSIFHEHEVSTKSSANTCLFILGYRKRCLARR